MKTATLTKEQALDALEEMGAHKIVAEDWANEIGAPFDVTFKEVEFTHDPEDFKGPQESCMGVDIHYIADTIRWSACKGISFYPLLVEPQSVTLASTSTGAAIGIKSPRFTGLGSQFRTDIEAVRKVVTKAS